jgi:hypothetical protein
MVLVAVAVVGCSSADSTPSATPADPGPSAGAAASGTVAVDMFSMSGSASKTSPATDLAGEYVLTTKVKAKSGCTWSVRLEGEPPLVEHTGDGATATTLALTGLFPASYRLVVKSTKCGAWSVGLKRP